MRHFTKSSPRISAAVLAALISSISLPAHALGSDAAELSLEDLLNTEVVTVSRKPQSLQTTAAAAFVISREDIERAGATSVPEALRLAPGIEVARMANNHWAVTARGFNGRFANKLLVLMDGRSIYSPLFSGVLWEFEDTLLEDVDRIEVIRGPGASLWGSNAVNGVINIITRKARDSQGDLLVGGAGSSAERAFGAYRHGGVSDDGHYRIWAKAFDRGASETTAGTEGRDTWRAARAGFRRDGLLASGSRYTVSGEAYTSPTGDRWREADPTQPSGYAERDEKLNSEGAHVLGRVEWRTGRGDDAALQSYLDYSNIDVPGLLQQKRATFDVDYQLHAALDARNDLIAGLGYRASADSIRGSGFVQFARPHRTMTLFSAFVQDEYTLLPDTLRVIAGARLEHNNLTGFEPQPNLRMVWTPAPSQSFWAALSRAARIPSRSEIDAQIDLNVTPAQPPYLPLPVLTRVVASGDGNLSSEHIDTAELGYRQQIDSHLSFDLAAFVSRYRNLRSAQLGAQGVEFGTVPYALQTIRITNDISARTHGFEAALDWRATPWWRLQATYSSIRITGSTSSTDPATLGDAASVGQESPRGRWSLRSSIAAGNRQNLDVWIRHVDALDTVDALGNTVPSYTALDLRYAWRPVQTLELSVVGQNLLARRHAEFTPDALPSQSLVVGRTVFVKAKYQF